MERTIAWYPGHMAKSLRRMREHLSLVDVVVEVVDARIPHSGRNPLLDELAEGRERIVTLGRADLADPRLTRAWVEALSKRGLHALAVDAREQRSVGRITSAIASATGDKSHRRRVVRAMIVGVPNSGKSTIVNGVIRRSAAKREDRAGVTRALQWFRLDTHVELMDTPGVLPTKIAGAGAQWRLALCGAVPRDKFDPQEVAAAFHAWAVDRLPRRRVPDLEAFAATRGFKQRGGNVDYHNAAQSYIRAFNDGLFGRISLESPDDAKAA